MKRAATITENEFQEFESRKRIAMFDIAKRSRVLAKHLSESGKHSICEVLGEGIISNDEYDCFVPTEGSIWSSPYLDLGGRGPLKSDIVLRNSMGGDIGQTYSRILFQGIPCSPKLEKLIEEAGKKIRDVNDLKNETVAFINREIGYLIWEEAEEFMESIKDQKLTDSVKEGEVSSI